MKVSVITATYNSQANIINCIMSVNSQKYKNIQHVFIDGLSTDNTVDVIKQYSVRDAKLFQRKMLVFMMLLIKELKYQMVI